MKSHLKILTVLAIIFSSILPSCSKDKDENKTETIVGNWTFKDVAAKDIQTNKASNDAKFTNYLLTTLRNENEGYTYSFSADGVLQTQIGSSSANVNYTFTNNILTLDDDGVKTELKARLENGLLILKLDEKDNYQNIELDKLLEMGITDIDFEVNKAVVTLHLERKK
ncbi:hypothetical protein [Niabella ginsengisoli]|uniref:Lipocalin-like domain-containing protein n=1 Tax=Niabella ginsengisoli TaxID=522298 RepID=A0ABS9SHY1_9BACT|nr:hypothetical protein [Niabella ginsengisoli]MCH5597982.1 hypothetical protein [Niabella ginsengisoli]